MKKLVSSIACAGLLVASTGLQAKTGVLTDTDHREITGRKHSAKAWKKFDKLLTAIILASGGAGLIGHYVPEDTYELPYFKCTKEDILNLNLPEKSIYPVQFSDDVPRPSVKTTGLGLPKTPFIKASLITAIGAMFIKVAVKFKRAHQNNKNIIRFLISDIFA